MRRRAFTLVELLVTLAIVAILAVVVFVAVNPAQILMQGRDASRMADLKSLNGAIAMYQGEALGSLGSTSTVYVSLADASSTCGSWGLPSLPSGWTYQCAPSSTYQAVSGAGWIPLHFAALSTGSPLSRLPVDPVNVTTSFHYYTYVTNGSQWQLSANMESSHYLAQETAQTGDAIYYAGTNLSLAPFVNGLIGWWKFNEGTGTIAYDSSGYGHNGTIYNGTWLSGSSCKDGSCLNFNGTNSYVQALNAGAGVSLQEGHTILLWFNPAALGTGKNILANTWTPYLSFHNTGNQPFHAAYINGTQANFQGNEVVSVGNWYQVGGTYDNTAMNIYLNGALDATTPKTGADAVRSTTMCIGAFQCNSYWTNGSLDDVRMYNRALSAAEIQALYNAEK